MLKKFKIACIQNAITATKTQTLALVKDQIKEAAIQGSKVCILGECFNSYYVKAQLQNNAEDFGKTGERQTLDLISEISKQFGIMIIGSIPEKSGDKMYNTAFCFNNGQLLVTYRKTHLFDIDIPGKITYKESLTFSAGDNYKIVDTEYGKFGIGICYDIRFPELAQIMREKGCHFLVYPGSFNLTTGPLHWELLLKARAVDYQCYVAGVSSARYMGNDESIYKAWGHSTLLDPMAKVLATCEHDPSVIISEVDLDYLEQVRQQIPVSQQRRNDIYELICKK
ncbi:unnamed protein product (macronuclear) [Paramecium tetraurelia]|uniref:CN hydrolase domain-containing protein n=1 Tax=Paramecium tetraurelia TaxID=5888 RepID=A0BR54_PARTE|nr:uncharacterized protein GSPATT00031251001 [Paramecium tetraurelia]CAK61021.1 unnamed protein product [Paramecium tetraurelia]|eukprot:XP_001428419.1 hypothetical protein (macronuclear) [Paramecium tetraurelia strain d4-2]